MAVDAPNPEPPASARPTAPAPPAPRTQFFILSRILHWLMAAMLLAMLFIGVTMVASLAYYPRLLAIHRPLGILILIFAIVRLINRKLTTLPDFPPTMSPLERRIATASEKLLYTLMVSLPLVGWAMLSAGHYPIVMVGSLHLPPILPANPLLFAFLRRSHTLLAYLLFLTFLAHLSAVLFHTLIIRDRLLNRMALWPVASRTITTHEAQPPAQKLAPNPAQKSKESSPMEVQRYKNVIIGSGEGGKYLAWHLAGSLGEQTMVIERRWIGGSCPNINCLPSKNEIWSAKVADLVQHAQKFGITTGPVKIDIADVRQRKRAMVEAGVAFHKEKYKSTGVELVLGEAKLTAPRTIEIHLNDDGTGGGGVKIVQAERLFLNLGTHATIPPIPGLADAAPLTHIEMLELDRLPAHLVVIGGGYVGLEFAQAYRRFGSRVTILHRGAQLLPDQDPDVAAELTRFLAAEGIDIITSANITRVEGRSGSSVTLTLNTPAGENKIAATDILIATGRTPNTANIGLDLAQVALNQSGYIQVNDRLETTAPNTWAIGECAGSPQFTHVSFDDFRILRDNLASPGGATRSTKNRLIPSCLFTDPQIAHIGLTESQAHDQNIPYRLAKLPTASILRAQTLGETAHGFLKALISENDRILGFTIIAPEAGEVVSLVQLAMQTDSPFTVLRDMIITHPTMSEGLTPLFATLKPTAVAR